ncbi:autotransporter outer membrane beta-barrel domain-containing protein [Morganella morganii]|uniref:autotransporter outer membrane beta-barrel domain-containing protein n=1 Tax=Morganella morganii TaxID=582 RepID=UPI0021D1C488|nr:autotransporter outer membrane beta-barrel domain-containing protein [Morganella morganii]MCU6274718.1 autotransporter outer membrane beta-barrel domain-containing protein [Morganella morganii]
MMQKTVLANTICGVLLVNSMTASAAITYQYEKDVTNRTVIDNQVGIKPGSGDDGKQTIGQGGKSINSWIFDHGSVQVNDGGILDKAKVGAPRKADELENGSRQNLYMPTNLDGEVYIFGGGKATDTQIIGKGIVNVDKDGLVSNTSVGQMGVLRFFVGGESHGALNVDRQAFIILDNDNFHSNDKNTVIEKVNLAGNLLIQDKLTEERNDNYNIKWEGRDININPASYFQVASIDELHLDHSSVSLKPKIKGTDAIFNELVVKDLSGQGAFSLHSQIADDVSDKLVVTNNATGNFSVSVYDTGKDIVDPDETVELIEINKGDAEFRLAGKNGVVDLGIYKYRLIKGIKSNGKSTWYLATKADHIPYPDIDPDGETQGEPDIDKNDEYVQEIDTETGKDVTDDTSTPELRDVLSNSALAGLSMASVNRQILRSENMSGPSRRHITDSLSAKKYGAWANYRYDNAKFSDSKSRAFRNHLNILEIGYDKVNKARYGDIAFGLFTSAGKTRSTFDYTPGQGNTDSFAIGGYTHWQYQDWYIAGMLKGSYFKNRVNTQSSGGGAVNGSFKQNALTVSADAGKKLHITPEISLTPYGRIDYSRFSEAKYQLSNGMDIHAHNSDSVNGEIGSRLSMDTHIDDIKISPFVNIGVSHEFVKNNKVTLNQKDFSAKNETTTGKYQMGATIDLTPDTRITGSLGYRHGDKNESPVSAYIGLKVSF